MDVALILELNPLHKRAVAGVSAGGGSMMVVDFDDAYKPHGPLLRLNLGEAKLLVEAGGAVSLTDAAREIVKGW